MGGLPTGHALKVFAALGVCAEDCSDYTLLFLRLGKCVYAFSIDTQICLSDCQMR